MFPGAKLKWLVACSLGRFACRFGPNHYSKIGVWGCRRCVAVTMAARLDLYKTYYPDPNPKSNPNSHPHLGIVVRSKSAAHCQTDRVLLTVHGSTIFRRFSNSVWRRFLCRILSSGVSRIKLTMFFYSKCMLVEWDSHDTETRAHNHRDAPTAAIKKVNQIGRFIFNSAKHKNVTCLSERHSLHHMTSFLSWHWTCIGYDKLFTNKYLHRVYRKTGTFATSHRRLRRLMYSLLWNA